MENKIFLLKVKKDFCIGVFRLGTESMEFIVGKTDNDRVYRKGEEVSYIYNAEYFSEIEDAVSYLNEWMKLKR